MPLFLRKERGDLQITKLKIQETDLERRNKDLELKNKIRAYQTEIENLNVQIQLFRSAVQNYQRLLQGEKRKFEEGESSLFLVNTRETKYFEAKLKLNELRTKYFISNTGFIWAIGTLHQL
jgi:outer membrane protein TolC